MTAELPAVGVVGLGLIGGGIALDLARSGHEVVGFDHQAQVLERAGQLGIETATDLSGVVERSELVVVAVPLGAVASVLAAVRRCRDDVLITDVASVKDAARLDATDLAHWVGGHPMAGNERSGIDAARPGLFDGAVWYLTPTAQTRTSDLLDVLGLVRAVQAEPVVVDAATHDRYVALLSHVPHLLAYGMQASATEMMGNGVHGLGGGSFRDVTRVAASAPAFWADVLHANRAAVREALTLLETWLDAGADDLGEPHALQARLSAARRHPHPRPHTTGTELRLPPSGEPLGATAHRLCELGATGMCVTDIEADGDDVTVRLTLL